MSFALSGIPFVPTGSSEPAIQPVSSVVALEIQFVEVEIEVVLNEDNLVIELELP